MFQREKEREQKESGHRKKERLKKANNEKDRERNAKQFFEIETNGREVAMAARRKIECEALLFVLFSTPLSKRLTAEDALHCYLLSYDKVNVSTVTQFVCMFFTLIH